MPTIADIAKYAAVSPAVVSRVINRDPTLRVSDETRERVNRAVDALDFTPNAAARALRSSKSGLIAFVVHDVTNPVYGEVLRGAQMTASQSGNALLISEASNSGDRASRLVELVGGRGVDGLILQADGGISDLILARAARERVSTVLLQAELDVPAHLLRLPDKTAAAMATSHLVDLGHREIACVATEAGLSFTERRAAGWRAVLKSAHMNNGDDRIAYCPTSIENGRKTTVSLLSGAPTITAVVCFNFVTALGAVKGIRELGWRVPEDISVVTIHDLAVAEFLETPLTAVRMPLFAMGTRAVELILRRSFATGAESVIDDPKPQLIVRRSSAPPRC